MDSKDFGFLYRKEFIILCLLLLGISFAQIASKQQLSAGTRIIGVDPIFILRNMFFEVLGIFLPLFAVIYLFFQKRSEKDKTGIPIGRYLYVIGTIFILILAIPILSTSEEIIPEDNTTATITTPIPNPSSIINPTNPAIPPHNNPSFDSQFLDNFLNIARNSFLFLLLFLPLLIIYFIHHRSKTDSDIDTDIEEIEQTDSEKTQLARTILECYYQSSNRLEERGADDSPAFTPIEFLKDVIDKKLIPLQGIEELTQIFEEAKFSDNEMTYEQVKIAKKIASSIILAHEEILRDLTNDSGQKPKEENP
ncbi:MAG: DUF4129 domain-containing protein [Candidatus Heimdallarchaeota archaeon]|nr:DUF4129 domain-containing protein [Candidatus Heimdallarchaeota archaeon]